LGHLTRDATALSARTFDLLVVGGGIYGLTVACDAAQRGLDVALIERGDFGGESSFNHARTIHGGLRYLQNLDVARSRSSIRERRALARIAPHAVRPTPFALPLFASLVRGRLALRAGFLLDRAIGFDRNRDVVKACHLPRGRVISAAQAVERFPGLGRRHLKGAAVWYDYVTPEADRLTFAWALAAARHQASLANYVEAVAPLTDGRRVVGVKAIDRTDDRRFEISARFTVNATGAAVDRLLTPLDAPSGLRFLKAMNLVTRREAGDEALGGRSGTGRNFFLVPYRGRALFGTWASTRPVSPDKPEPDDGDVEQFIGELNQAYPALDLTAADVTLVHRGIVPAVVRPDGSTTLEGRELVLQPHDISGLLSVVGTKYTTARGVAERVVDRAMDALGRPRVPCRTASTPLPGGDIIDPVAAVSEARRRYDRHFPSDTIPYLIAAYGSKHEEMLEFSMERPEWRSRVDERSPVVGGQLAWAARHEMVVSLADAVLRRTSLGSMGNPGDTALQRAAAIVGDELGWSTERVHAEVASLKAASRTF
jgi:glycerol-3-phosphate dehydrogenase